MASTLALLSATLDELDETVQGLKKHELFVLWVLNYYAADDDETARRALNPPRNERSADAVLIDDDNRKVVIVQGKYHLRSAGANETWPDVSAFAALPGTLVSQVGDFRRFLEGVDPAAVAKFEAARDRVLGRGFVLQLVYATTGRVSSTLQNQARRTVRRVSSKYTLEFLDTTRLRAAVDDYRKGLSRGIGTLVIKYERAPASGESYPLFRTDRGTGIESWIVSVPGDVVGRLYHGAGDRLFARNIRGYLGDEVDVNREIRRTIVSTPELFWYFNNGITIVCDDAEDRRNQRELQVFNPQVINGQQTVRSLSGLQRRASRTSVIVRVMRIPRDRYSGSRFDDLVGDIVVATNWQNEIDDVDIHANDTIQIQIERNLRAYRYQYIRKRISRQEARKALQVGFRQVKMQDLAYASIVCEHPSNLVVKPGVGRSGVFRKPWYKQAFPTSRADYHLLRYCTMTLVKSLARESYLNTFTKWLVLHYVFGRIRSQVTLKAQRDLIIDYVRPSPTEREIYHPVRLGLKAVIRTAYEGSRAYYRKSTKAAGKERVDPASFFKEDGRDSEFEGFWAERTSLKRAQRLERELKRLESAMAKALA